MERLYNEASSEGDISPIYAAISAFLDLLNFLTGSGLENYPMKQPGDADSPEVEKNGTVKMEDQTEPAETIDAAVASTNIGKSTATSYTASSLKTEPLRRTIFIRASQLKVIFQLDGPTASESPLTKIEKLIEVGLLAYSLSLFFFYKV